jgi:hypothetical protein
MNHGRADEELASLAASKLVLSVQDVEGKDPVVSRSTLSDTVSQSRCKILVCDAGYGFPREARPRREKLLAIARQLANFLQWQEQQQLANNAHALALCQVVGCPDESIRSTLEVRTLELLQQDQLPAHVEFSCQSLEEYCQSCVAASSEGAVSPGEEATLGHDNCKALEPPRNNNNTVVYLSPDADTSLDSNQPPPTVMIIGLLVDRKVQRNRSKDRATALQITQKRLPLDEFLLVEEEEDDDDNNNTKNNQSDNPAPATTTIALDRHEPLNIDCILEVIQQWWWNCAQIKEQAAHNTTHPDGHDGNGIGSKDRLHNRSGLLHECFVQATSQAMDHHSERHPARPIHSTSNLERK